MNAVNRQAQYLKDCLDLTLEIQAVKFIEDPDDVPKEAIIAEKEYGHLALCQALALAKRARKTVYTTKAAEWCWAPLVALGYVSCEPGDESFQMISKCLGMQDPKEAEAFLAKFPTLPRGKYCGVLIAPARFASFDPDVLLINCDNNYQIRTLFGAIKYKSGKLLDTSFDMIDSCVHTLIQSMITREYTMAIPDPGDQERALSDRHEIILGVPAERMADLIEGCEYLNRIHIGYHDMQSQMQFDFERPAFYNRIYELWGLNQGKVWDREHEPE